MDILENDLEDIIENMFKEKSDLVYSIGCGEGIILRQPDLKGYGTMDLVNIVFTGFDYKNTLPGSRRRVREWDINILELKRGKLGFNELSQLCRYVTGVERFINHINLRRDNFKVYGVLLGKSVETNGDFVYLLENLKTNISAYTFKLDYKTGIEFEKSYGWHNGSEEFSKKNLAFLMPEIKKHFKEESPQWIDFEKMLEGDTDGKK